MTTSRKVIFGLLLLGMMVIASACASTSYEVLSVEDHPNGEVTLLKTLTTNSMAAGVWDSAQYNYWECRRDDQGLNCEKTCWNRGLTGKLPDTAPQDAPVCAGQADPGQ